MSEHTRSLAQPGRLDKARKLLSTLIAIGLCVFHLLAASPYLLLNNTELAVIHGMLIVIFFVLVKPIQASDNAEASLKAGKFWLGTAIVSGVLCVLFVFPPVFSKSPFNAGEKNLFVWVFAVSAVVSVIHLPLGKMRRWAM